MAPDVDAKLSTWTLKKSEDGPVRARQAYLGCWMMDLATGTFSASDEVLHIFAIDPAVRRTADMSFIVSRIHPDDRDRFVRSFEESMSSRQLQSMDLKVLGEDGAVRLVHAEGDFIADEEGRLLSVFGIVEDITDRRFVEEVLHESEERYHKILNAVQIGITVIDPATHRILEANDKALSMFNAPREHVIGAVCHRFICPAELGKCPVTDLKQVVDVSERSVLKADGEKIPVLKTVVMERIGERDVLIESFMDLTQLKAAEHALRDSEERFRVLAETTSSAIFILQDGRFAYANPAANRLTGYATDEILSMRFLDIVHPEHGDMIAERLQALSSGGDVPYRAELKYLDKAGQARWAEINVGRMEYNHRPALIVTAFDVTDRKQAEEKLRVSLHEKEVLLKEIHHRVKNNMQIISSLLGLQAGLINDPKTVEALENSRNRVRSMALIHEMLYQTGNFTRINFKEYVDRLASYLLLSYNTDRERVRVATEIGDVNLEIERAIPCGLIINELVTNAIKYAFPGRDGGTITVRLMPEKDGVHVLEIRDDGVGIPAEIDLENARTLGMRLVNTLVDQLDGRIEVGRDGGTRFTIRF